MPDSIQFSKPLHIPVLTGLYVDNVPLNASQSTLHPEDLIDTSSVYTNNLYFYPKSNTYSFEFSTFNFHNQRNTYFKYRLKELDTKWNHTLLGENRITYNYLPSGQYTLEVQAYENNISSPARSILIYIASPWYLTPWAWTTYCAGIILTIIGLVCVYLRHENHKKEMRLMKKKFVFLLI